MVTVFPFRKIEFPLLFCFVVLYVAIRVYPYDCKLEFTFDQISRMDRKKERRLENPAANASFYSAHVSQRYIPFS